MTRWLTEDEQRAWLRLAGVMLKLTPSLDSQLQRDSDLNHFDYLCLAMLSETHDRTMTMSALAGRTNASLSRLSHVIKKLEERGWVSRCPSPSSGRVTLVSLTDTGWTTLVAAAPAHVETVRSLVFEGLSEEDVSALERISGQIVARIEGAGLDTTC
ncbi:MAG: MarR family winged helix-turn-helix transcriptional regulator [Nocardioidaceae bacterium]